MRRNISLYQTLSLSFMSENLDYEQFSGIEPNAFTILLEFCVDTPVLVPFSFMIYFVENITVYVELLRQLKWDKWSDTYFINPSKT